MKRLALSFVAAIAVCTSSVSAGASTPTNEALRAGRVEELTLMLNAVALRCNTIGINLQSQYERFTERQRPALVRAQEALKQHFEVKTNKDLHADFDRFHIRILNFYGTGRTDQQSCNAFAKLMDTLAEADANGDLLTKVAEIMVPEPLIEP